MANIRIAANGQAVQIWTEKPEGSYPVIHILGDTWAVELHTVDMVRPYPHPGRAAMIRMVDLMHPRRSSIDWLKEFCYQAEHGGIGGEYASRYIWLAPPTPGRTGLEAEPMPNV